MLPKYYWVWEDGEVQKSGQPWLDKYITVQSDFFEEESMHNIQTKHPPI